MLEDSSALHVNKKCRLTYSLHHKKARTKEESGTDVLNGTSQVKFSITSFIIGLSAE